MMVVLANPRIARRVATIQAVATRHPRAPWGCQVRGLKPTATIGGRSATKCGARSTMTSDSEPNVNEPAPAVIDAARPPRGRFQFSLATLLWLTTLAACLAALWATYRDLQQSRNELRSARDEIKNYLGAMGSLEISDPEKAYVREITTMEEDNGTWSWRVYLPNKTSHRLCIATSRIPLEGFPADPSKSDLDPGEQRVDAAAGPTQNGAWRYLVKTVRFSIRSTMPCLDDEVHNCDPVESQQRCVDPSSPLVLLRLRKWRQGKWTRSRAMAS